MQCSFFVAQIVLCSSKRKSHWSFSSKMRYYIWPLNYKAVMRRGFISLVNFVFYFIFFHLVQSFWKKVCGGGLGTLIFKVFFSVKSWSWKWNANSLRQTGKVCITLSMYCTSVLTFSIFAVLVLDISSAQTVSRMEIFLSIQIVGRIRMCPVQSFACHLSLQRWRPSSLILSAT